MVSDSAKSPKRGLQLAGMRLLLLLLPALLPPAAAHAADPMVLDPDFEPARYLGTWYEIARMPNRFQAGCVGTTATYSLRDDGDFRVENRCREDTFDGAETGITGKAWIPDPAEPAKWKVRFFWPFSADYWILEVGPEYEYALVGEPDRDKAWILARRPQLDEKIVKRLVARLRAQGYDVERLEWTPQRPAPPESGR